MNAITEIAGQGHNLRDPLDAEMDDALKLLREQFDERSGEVDRAKVTTEDEAARATALAGIMSNILIEADKKRTEIKKPFLDASRKIDGTFGGFIEKVKEAKAKVLGMIGNYQAEQRRIADQERERLERLAEEKQRQADAAAQSGSALAAARLETQAAKATEQAQAAAAPVVIRSLYGQTASTRKEWKFQITDRGKLPAVVTQHPKVTEAMESVIGALVRSGTRDIPGVRIYAEDKPVVRR